MEKLTDKDKRLHFLVCMIISILSPAMAYGAAIGKEYGDYKAKGNHWCWLDLLADMAGICVGVVIRMLIFYLSK